MEIPYGYCHCGCGEKTDIPRYNDAKNNQTAGVPLKYRAYHHRRKSGVEYIVDPDSGCWVWQRATKWGGYGMLRRKDASGTYRAIPAHRHVYERETGRTIPQGFHLDHLCGNPPCVNPAHLEPVTPAENLRRGKNSKLTMEKARHIRTSESSVRELSRLFGVSESCVRSVRRGITWKEPDESGSSALVLGVAS